MYNVYYKNKDSKSPESNRIEPKAEQMINEGTPQNLDLYSFLINKREHYYHLDQVKACRENFKNELYESWKKDKFDHLNMIENLQNMNMNIDLNSYNQAQFHESKTHKNHNLFLNTEDKDYLNFYSCVREKVYQLFLELVKDLEPNIEKAKHIARNNSKVFEGSNVSKDEAWTCYMKKTSTFYKSYSSFVQNLPGFDKINIHDLFKLSNNNCAIINCLSKSELYIEDEFYLMADGIQITRKFLDQFFSTQVINCLFELYHELEKLDLSRKEMGLLMAYMLTSTDRGTHFNICFLKKAKLSLIY